MTELIFGCLTGKNAGPQSPEARERCGKLAGFAGIVSNLLLFALKLLVGIFSNSISVMADAVNNLSDSASSLITVIGFKLAGRPADEKHPYGHARYEYISGLLISCIILVIGFQFLLSSFRKALNPEPVEFSAAALLALAASVVVKLLQGAFYRRIGAAIGSSTLTAAAADSRNDALTTSAVLVSAAVARFTGLNLDGYTGMLVALFILWSGVGLIRDTLDPLLGLAPDRELVASIQEKILGYETVIGLHDLMVHNYGPGRCFSSVHVEFPAGQDIMLSHDIIDNIERDFAREMNIALVIHLDPVVTDDPALDALKRQVGEIALSIDPVLSIHDFRMVAGPIHTNLIFDVVVPSGFKLEDAALLERFDREIKTVNEAYFCVVNVDRSYISTK